MASQVNRVYTSLLMFIIFLSIAHHSISQSNSLKVDHSIFDGLLKKYVDEQGLIDYENFALERKRLKQYLNGLSSKPPDPVTWSEQERLAYWINLYNAFTTELILEYYPVKSIRDIGTEIPLFYADSPWDIEFINIGDTLYTLDKIEHEILAKRFNEPRIHFALVCAAKSCPNLRREAYAPQQLESQLNNQATSFLSDEEKNAIQNDTIQISEIFKWYSSEFTRDQTLISYLNQFLGNPIQDNATIEYIPFDWSLNDTR